MDIPRPKTADANEWQVWLIQNNVDSDNAPYIAVQICEAIEEMADKIDLKKD